MRYGFLYDDPGYLGGAELSTRLLIDTCPGEIVRNDADVLIVGNLASYGPEILSVLRARPFVFYSHDAGHNLHPAVREVLLSEAQRVVFASPDAVKIYTYPVSAPVEVIPPAMNLEPFHAVRGTTTRRGTFYLGTIHPFKGVGDVIAWARQRQEHVDFYGPGEMDSEAFCHYRGAVEFGEVPALMASYERFIFFPRVYEPFGRTLVEAQAAGCEVLSNGRAGALWWMANQPERIDKGAEMFWEMVESLTLPTY